MDFPTFDGTNPRLWRDKCETYFEIFVVSDELKPRFAALNFTDAAAAWLQTVELRGRITSWEVLHQAVCDRFDKDQYQLHMKQLDNLRQTSSVTEYHAKFEQLAHSILLYNPNYDDTFLVVRFLSGLKEEIRAPIALHRPRDVDTASALALLQEEELESRRRSFTSKHDYKEHSKPSSKDFTVGEKFKAMMKREDPKKVQAKTAEDRMAALLAFRRSKGLCFTCGEKWTGRNHKCPDQVPIQVIQEVMEILQADSSSDGETGESEPDNTEDCLLSVQYSSDTPATVKRRKTMRFHDTSGK
jgi:hypothetical protein